MALYNEEGKLQSSTSLASGVCPGVITIDTQGYDVEMMTKLRLVDATPDGTVEWELEITPFYGNLNGAPLNDNCFAELRA